MKGLQDVEKAAQGEFLWLPEIERKIVWAWALRIPMSYLARDHAAARVHVSYLVSYLARDHAAARVHAGSWRAAKRRSMAYRICALFGERHCRKPGFMTTPGHALAVTGHSVSVEGVNNRST
jgi:hypothetical protein